MTPCRSRRPRRPRRPHGPRRPRVAAGTAGAALLLLAALAVAPAALAQPFELTWTPQDPVADEAVTVRLQGNWFNGCVPVLDAVLREPSAADYPELYPDPAPPLPIASRWVLLLDASGDTCTSAFRFFQIDVALAGLPAGHNRVLAVVDGLQLAGPAVLDMVDIPVGGGAETLLLHGGRFRATVEWADFQGNDGPGKVVPGRSATSGLFSFFTSDNWEVMVKVLDGCTVNGRFWVFVAAATNVDYTLRIEDTASGQIWEHANPSGALSPAFADTAAFDTCGDG